ncbi:MAG: PDZ domain-containing protein [Acidobacteria bacterium]|nr:MAG: PDZ domain-containing protein [Acidobacteriota bacterium]REK01350.1 MAG: PDZ domain-containing protein [Acidobacteriota bacterium]REK14306.1 MAG: PDZ domain-containing protein [Acidobacteriota bacterium]REK45021.1 MAG: PDZ domain-containing protein [Acidobacteriota bacterium]
MTYRGKFTLAVISSAIALFAFAPVLVGFLGDVTGYINAQQPINDPGAQIRIFESVLQHIQNDYVDEPDLEKVRNGALRGLADGLDPYSSYLTAEQVADYRAGKDSGRAGIGAEFSQVSAYLYLVSVVKDSPADKAGLMPGDVIEYIDTKATRDISLYDAVHLVLGDPGTKVKLRVLRSGAKPQTIEVTRSVYSAPDASTETRAGVGIVKVYSLDKGKSASVARAVSSLKSKGVKKIILDLRNVGGGDIEEAANVANLFIREGELAKVIGRQNAVIRTYSADASKHVFDGKAAVLIDLGSAGAAEVVAAAFLDSKRGDVVGEKSFGAGVEQDLFTLKGGDGFLLTIAKWASPSGNPFLASSRANAGVKPSVEVKRPETPEPVEVEELVEAQEEEDGIEPPPVEEPVEEMPSKPAKPGKDIQLEKAIEILNGKAAAAGA